MTSNPIIRRFGIADGPAFVGLVRALAETGGVEGPDDAAAERLVHDAFSDPPPFEVRLAEVDGHLVGYMVFFMTYSTFLGKPSLFIEDMFVVGDARGHGVGVALFDAALAEALDRGCCRIDWSAPKRMAGAVAFYRARGARIRDDWHLFRLDGDGFTLSH